MLPLQLANRKRDLTREVGLQPPPLPHVLPHRHGLPHRRGKKKEPGGDAAVEEAAEAQGGVGDGDEE